MFEDAELFEQSFNNDLSRHSFKYSEVSSCEFNECKFAATEFLGSVFNNCTFTNCNLGGAFLTGVVFEECGFVNCYFGHAYIFRSQIKNCTIEGGSLGDAMLSTVDFTGTSLQNVDWRGTPINSAPIIIDGIEYPVVALDNGHMHVGCEYNTYEWFYNTDEKHSARMEGLRARRFWKRNKQWIFQMIESRGLFKP